MSSTANEIWDAISEHTGTLAEQTGNSVVAVAAGHRVAASGVHWRSGVIVTASHLVRRAAEVNIILPDGHTVNGTVAGRDSTTDLAAVRLDSPKTLGTLPLASGARVGELVLAVPRSFVLLLADTLGTVSRSHRSCAR